MTDELSLAERVRLFHAGRLPRQKGFHLPTAQLVRDLWIEREELIDALKTAQMALTDLPAAIRDGYVRRAKAKISYVLERAAHR
jgi:hypothetical protein